MMLPTPQTLAVGEHIDITVDGHTVRIDAIRDGDGSIAIQLGGVDCDLDGDTPGTYYLQPLR